MLKITSLNVNSIIYSGRRNLLADFIKKNPSEIYLIQETKINNNIKLFYPGFNILRGDNRRGFGGTAIFIKHGIPIRNVSTCNKSINYTSCEIKLGTAWLKIYSVYFTHNQNDIDAALTNIVDTRASVIIGGDFNARHTSFGDCSNNQYGLILENSRLRHDFTILNPGAPTCYHSTYGSFIDKFVKINTGFPTTDIRVLPTFSDHSGIQLELVCDFSFTPGGKTLIRNFHLTQIPQLNRFIERRFDLIPLSHNKNHTIAELDNIADTIDLTLKSAVERTVPTTVHSHKTLILPHYIRTLQTESKRLQRILHENHGTLNFQFFVSCKTRIALLKNMICNAVKNETSRFFCDVYDGVSNTRDAFKIIKKYTGLKSTVSPTSGIFTDDTHNTLLSGESAISHALGKHFSASHNLTFNVGSSKSLVASIDNHLIANHTPTLAFNDQITANIEKSEALGSINSKLIPPFTEILTSADEVAKIIASRPNKKSSGRDDMPYFLIKHFSTRIVLFLTTFFNQCIANGHFPNSWRHAVVIPIPKPGKDATTITNWRPISQLNCISKIFERIIMNRIDKTLHGLDLLKNQYGFLSGHSTEHALSFLQSCIDSGLNNKKITSIIAIDLKSAFDTVWIDGLIHKMCKLGFNPLLIKNIKTMLTDRTFCVRLGNHFSESFNMPAGVPQGSVSGPTLFNIYVHDLPLHYKLNCIQYADDTTFFITHNNALAAQNIINTHLVTLNKYFNEWKMLVNHSKTEFINIIGFTRDTNRRTRREARNMIITNNKHMIGHSTSIRLLGVHFQSNNRFIRHINNRLVRANFAKYKLNRFFKRRKIPVNVRCNIYKMYLRPILSYAAPVWCRPPNITSHQMERLRSFERGVLRTATGYARPRGSFLHSNASNLYADASCPRIDRYMATRHCSFYSKLGLSNIPKFTKIVRNFPIGSSTYPRIDLFSAMHNNNQLVLNDQLIIFNKRYNGQPGLVYSINQ